LSSCPPVIEPFDHDVDHSVAHTSIKFHGQIIQYERDILVLVLAVHAAPQLCSCWLACISSLFHRSSDHVLQPQFISYPCTCL
jgi:hypothetical protein